MGEIDEATKKKKAREAIVKMKAVFLETDVDGSGDISLEEFEKAVGHNPVVRECLTFLGMPLKDAKHLFRNPC
jgi:Ca2+-binding EF-hand superfamily protein